jgi:hypothetical protein
MVGDAPLRHAPRRDRSKLRPGPSSQSPSFGHPDLRRQPRILRLTSVEAPFRQDEPGPDLGQISWTAQRPAHSFTVTPLLIWRPIGAGGPGGGGPVAPVVAGRWPRWWRAGGPQRRCPEKVSDNLYQRVEVRRHLQGRPETSFLRLVRQHQCVLTGALGFSPRWSRCCTRSRGGCAGR